MLDWKKNEYKKIFIGILLFGILLRVIFFFIQGAGNQNEWEYGDIAENIINGKGYSFYYFEENNLTHKYNENASPSPSAYMAPGYVYYFVLIKIITNENIEQSLLFLINLFFFSITLGYLLKVSSIIFNEKTAIVAILIYTLVPEFIYTTYSIGTTQLYHLFLVLIIYYSITNNKRNNILPLILGIALLFRFELFLLVIILAAFYFYRKEYKRSILIVFIPIIFLSPWVVRNYIVFDEIIPFSTTGGLNLFRGNNEVAIGGWHNFNTLMQIHSFEGDSTKIELFLNDMYLNEVQSYLSNNPVDATINFGKKLIYFCFYNPIEQKSMDVFYILPWFILLSLTILGIIKSREKKTKIIYLILGYHVLIGVIFVPLVRYQTMMKVALIPIAAYGLKLLFDKRSKKFTD